MSVDLKSEVISFKLSLISIVFIMLITVLFLNAPGINKGLAGSGISCSEICAERSGKDFCLPENVGCVIPRSSHVSAGDSYCSEKFKSSAVCCCVGKVDALPRRDTDISDDPDPDDPDPDEALYFTKPREDNSCAGGTQAESCNADLDSCSSGNNILFNGGFE